MKVLVFFLSMAVTKKCVAVHAFTPYRATDLVSNDVAWLVHNEQNNYLLESYSHNFSLEQWYSTEDRITTPRDVQ